MFLGIFMIVFGVVVFLYGFYINKASKPLLIGFSYSSISNQCKDFVSKMVMFVSCSAIIGGIIALFSVPYMIAFAIMVLIFVIQLFLFFKLFLKRR